MERISAASNLIIEAQPQSWRLLVNGSTGSERVLVEAVSGEPLRYGESFGSRRHLPESGMLPREDIQGVVLGWSEKDVSWHLGLVLKGALVAERGSRWCGLAHWHDPLANRYMETAIQAGQMLAEQLHLGNVEGQPQRSLRQHRQSKGLFKQRTGHAVDMAVALQQRDNFVGRDDALARVAPAGQHLEAGEFPRPQFH